MIGRILSGSIEIRRKIGAGGMGNVYEGFQEHLGRAVAVKVMTAEHARNPIAAEYFLREARAASQLRHPNIIQIIDYGQEDDDTIFIAMEFVPGKPLSKLIRHEFPLPAARITQILDQTLSGLAVAHQKELVHRDLKPDNLMVEQLGDSDFVTILDFGIAQSQAAGQEAGPLTLAGAVVGTPQYMSPEQATASRVDGRSDLFSLGVILYELLTQTSPFSARSLPEILIAVMRHHPQPPSAQCPELSIDPNLEAICLRALKKEPDLRFQTAEEFRAALTEFGTPRAPAPPPAQFIFKRSRSARAAEEDVDLVAEPDDGAIEPAFPDPDARTLAEFSGADAVSTARPAFSAEDLAGDLLSERALVTALVLHQRSHKRIDPESMSELRTNLDAAISKTAEEWGARQMGRQGSFVTLLFGVPTPTPDDSFRAVQAALSLRRSLRQFVPDGTVFGYAIAAGEVYCPSGVVEQAAGEPLDAATEAARVAGDDNVVATGPDLAIRLGTLFRLGAPDDEGHQAVLGVLDVGRHGPQSSESARSHVELIGRDAEIAAVLGAVGRLSKNRGSFLAVTGEAGVGKTAMISEVVRVAEQRGALVLSARWTGKGADAIRGIRLHWLLDFIRKRGHLPAGAQTALRETGLAPEYCRVLAAFVNERLEEAFGFVGQARRTPEGDMRAETALQVAMVRLCRALTSDAGKLVLVLDDVQALDDDVRAMLERWTATSAELPLLFTAGLRTTGALSGFKGAVEQMALEPLEDSASLAFLKVRLPSTIPANIVSRLARIGAGYPMHLEHLARYARSRGFDISRADEVLAQAQDVAELLRMRLYQQGKAHQNILAVLSGLVDGVPAEVLIDLAMAEWHPTEGLQALADEGLVEVSGDTEALRLHFRPPALRHVVYDRLSRKMRTQIHARAANLYEERVRAARPRPAREDVIALAYHREHSGDIDAATALLDELVARSFREHDYDGAVEILERQMALLAGMAEVPTQDLARLQLRLLRAEAAIGKRAQALDRCMRLDRSDELEPALAVEVRLELARLWLEDEDPELVGKVARGALTDIRKLQAADPDNLELRCLLVLALQLGARILERQNKLAPATELALEGAGVIERGEIKPLDNPWGPQLVWETLNQLGRIRLRMGELPAARKVFELARRVVTESDDLRGKVEVGSNVAAVLTAEGDIERAYKELSDALRIARGLGDPLMLAKLELNRGNILRRQRRLDMAIQAFDDALVLANDLDWRDGIATASDQLARLRRLVDEQDGKRR